EGHARAGKLAEHELMGSVLTVSNLGTMGVDRFTAIVNPPEAAILAVGRVADCVVAEDGVPVVRPMATLTLSVDHRVADGATAARCTTTFASEPWRRTRKRCYGSTLPAGVSRLRSIAPSSREYSVRRAEYHVLRGSLSFPASIR